MSKTIDKQDVTNQHHTILEYSNLEGLRVDDFIDVTITSCTTS